MQQLFEEAMAIDSNILNEREPLHGETWYFFGVKLFSSMYFLSKYCACACSYVISLILGYLSNIFNIKL